MKIKPEFSLSYDFEDIYIVRTLPDGSRQEIMPISETAAMAWEGFAAGIDRKTMIEGIVAEFTGAEETQVTQDLDQLAKQLVTLGYFEE